MTLPSSRELANALIGWRGYERRERAEREDGHDNGVMGGSIPIVIQGNNVMPERPDFNESDLATVISSWENRPK